MTVVLPTVDCDPGINFPCRTGHAGREPGIGELDAYRAAVMALFTAFDEHGLRGYVTWFLNELDVGWSRHYGDLVGEMVERADTVGLHVHHNGLFCSEMLTSRESVKNATASAKSALESVTGKPCVCHRSGCYYQASDVYSVLAELGFETLSDVFPGFRAETKGGFLLDNTMVPLSAGTWRHDADNWLDHTSRTGQFVHVPVSCGGVGGMPGLVEKAMQHGIDVLCWGIHPHEIQHEDGTINRAAVDMLNESLAQQAKTLAPVYKAIAMQ